MILQSFEFCKNGTYFVLGSLVLFKHFANKNQLPAFYISGTLAENGLTRQSAWYYYQK